MLVGLSASAAMAADLPSRVAPPVFVAPPIGYSWTGFEAGLHTSYVFSGGNNVRTVGRGTPAGDIRPGYQNTDKNGFGEVGGGIAYNYQFTPGSGIVIGAEASYDFVDLHKNDYVRAAALLENDYHQRLSSLGTTNGRLGYAFDRLLVYGTGGAAYGDPGYAATFFNPNGGVAYYGGNEAKLRVGYNFGGGVEYAIPDSSFINSFAIEKYLGFDKLLGIRASTVLKVEYIHYDLGSSTVILNGANGAAGTYALRYHTEGNQVRAGLVYSFGAQAVPVVARY